MQEAEIKEYAMTQLTLPDKFDPSDAMSWQHHLYSKLGNKKLLADTKEDDSKVATKENKQQLLEELVDRIVAMAKVLFGLHMVRRFLGFIRILLMCFKITIVHTSFMPGFQLFSV